MPRCFQARTAIPDLPGLDGAPYWTLTEVRDAGLDVDTRMLPLDQVPRALALRANFTVHDLADALFPYLTMVEGLNRRLAGLPRAISQLSCCVR